MVTPEQLVQLSLFTLSIYNNIENEILARMGLALRMEEGVQAEEIGAWQFQKLQQLGRLNDEAIAIIAKHAKMTREAVKEALEKAGYTGAAAQDEILQTIAPMVSVPPIAESPVLAGILLAYERQALEALNLVNTTMLDGTQQVYLDVINETTAKVLTGLRTPQQALRETAQKWGEKGIPTITDKAGRQWSTEAYVQVIIRSISNTVANEMQFARMDEYNIDLIEVSSHVDARPKCAAVQGKIYSRSGNSVKYPPWSSTGYGQPDSILGVNCRHVIYPYVEGKSTRRYTPYPLKEVQRRYEQSQQQRALERGIRKAKKALTLQESIGDKEGISAAKAKVREKQKAMRDFIATTGRKRRTEREQIV